MKRAAERPANLGNITSFYQSAGGSRFSVPCYRHIRLVRSVYGRVDIVNYPCWACRPPLSGLDATRLEVTMGPSMIPLFFMLLMAIPFSAQANTMDAPASLMAGPDGSFSYTITVTIGPDSVLVAGFGWDNIANVEGAIHGDCFCLPNCWLEPGEILEFDVEGQLVDPESAGTIRNWIAFCAEADISLETGIQPFDHTAVETTTWGRLKSLYR